MDDERPRKTGNIKAVDEILQRIGLKKDGASGSDSQRRQQISELIDEVKRFEDSGQIWIRIRKDLTFQNCSAFREALSTYRQQGFAHIRMDVSQVGFIDSATVAVLAGVQQELQRDKGSLYILNPKTTLANILRIVRLTQLIPVQDTPLPAADPQVKDAEPSEDEAEIDAVLRRAGRGDGSGC